MWGQRVGVSGGWSRTLSQSNENENRAARHANQIWNVAPATSTPKEKERRTSQSRIRSRAHSTFLLLLHT